MDKPYRYVTTSGGVSFLFTSDHISMDWGHGDEGKRRVNVNAEDIRKLKEACAEWLTGNTDTTIVRCSVCRGTNVHTAEWILPNSEQRDRTVTIADGEPYSDGDRCNNWCCDCEAHCELEVVHDDSK